MKKSTDQGNKKIFDNLFVAKGKYINDHYYLPVEDISDRVLEDIVERIFNKCSDKEVILPLNRNTFAVLGCLWMRKTSSDSETAISAVKTFFFIKKIKIQIYDDDLKKISRYRAPINVIMTGDRDCSACFEEQIILELKSLPKYSKVYNAMSKGVEGYAIELAKQYGLRTGEVKEDNHILSDFQPNIVIAFHTNIECSKRTRKIIEQAFAKNIPVYVHNLKRKSKFEGDFSTL